VDAQEYPFAILTTAGVDLIDPTPIESALSVYGEYLDEVAALLDHRD
jgi:oligoendopeptidase F